MAKQSLEKVIELAALDIADSLSPSLHPSKRTAMANFLVMALWTAASAAENVGSSSEWVDTTKDDGWVKREAEKELYDLPADLDNATIGALYRVLEEDPVKALRGIIPPRIKLEPELEQEIQKALGGASSPLDIGGDAASISSPGGKPALPAASQPSMTGSPKPGDMSSSAPKEQTAINPETGLPQPRTIKKEENVPAKEETQELTGEVETKPDIFEAQL